MIGPVVLALHPPVTQWTLLAAAVCLSACGSTTTSPSGDAGSGGSGSPSTTMGSSVTSGAAGGSGGSGGSGGATTTSGHGGSGGATTATATTGAGGALVIPDERFLATSVAVGFDAVCALTPSADVACWGESALGTSVQRQYFPELVPDVEDIVAVRSTGGTACALSEAGTLVCWGDGSQGQLGNDQSGDGYREDAPVAVVGLDEVADFAHSGAACAVRKDGSVWCWGANDRGQLGFDSEPCGPYALQLDTIVYTEVDCEERPRQVPGIETAVQVSVGLQHQCALLADESVVCWGAETGSELGRHETDATAPEVPAPVSGLAAIRKVAAGRYFTCALSTAGEVVCWGSNDTGTLGRGLTAEVLYSDPTPAPVVGLGPVTDLDVYFNTACAVTEGGEVYCWGDTSSLFAYEDKPDKTSTIELAPALVPYVSDAVQVSTHSLVACALKTSKEVVCWGLGSNGATGNGQIDPYGDYSGLPVVWDP